MTTQLLRRGKLLNKIEMCKRQAFTLTDWYFLARVHSLVFAYEVHQSVARFVICDSALLRIPTPGEVPNGVCVALLPAWPHC